MSEFLLPFGQASAGNWFSVAFTLESSGFCQLFAEG